MLSVHGGIVGGDCSVFEEVELVSVGRCGKYSCVAPVNVVLHVVAMFGRGGFSTEFSKTGSGVFLLPLHCV